MQTSYIFLQRPAQAIIEWGQDSSSHFYIICAAGIVIFLCASLIWVYANRKIGGDERTVKYYMYAFMWMFGTVFICDMLLIPDTAGIRILLLLKYSLAFLVGAITLLYQLHRDLKSNSE